MYDFQQAGAPIIGEYTYTLDIGDDYIETSASWIIYVDPGAKNPYLGYFSLLPCAFYGFHLNFDNPTNLAQDQQLNVTSNNAPVGQMGDLNLFANINPPLEQWVDAQAVAPESPTRITVGENTLDLNLQGMAWGWFQTSQGVLYTETSRIDLDFNCLADTNGDGNVNVADILQLIGAWGPCAGCNEDINNDGSVDVADLLDLIAAWGACP